jgi:hypothetical protein
MCFTDMSSLCKRSRDEVAATMERMNKRNIVIERTVMSLTSGLLHSTSSIKYSRKTDG